MLHGQPQIWEKEYEKEINNWRKRKKAGRSFLLKMMALLPLLVPKARRKVRLARLEKVGYIFRRDTLLYDIRTGQIYMDTS